MFRAKREIPLQSAYRRIMIEGEEKLRGGEALGCIWTKIP